MEIWQRVLRYESSIGPSIGVLEAYAADPVEGQGQSALSLLEMRNPIHVGCVELWASSQICRRSLI